MLLIVIFSISQVVAQQSPCKTNPVYRKFDFWIGDWEACANSNNAASYTGKSFNTYNAASGQWQQTWVDNIGSTTEYFEAKYQDKQMQFMSTPFNFSNDSMTVRRLTFFNLSNNRVRQLGEMSKDNGTIWAIEYDLDYRRKK